MMKPQRQPPEPIVEAFAYSPETAARSYGLSRTKIYDALKRGELVGRRVGRRTVIEVTELRRWLRSFPLVGGSSEKAAEPDAQTGARA